MTVEISDLAAFISVAESRGFRTAARKSRVSASGLSIAVKRLEAKLGVRLLNRTTRSVVATEAGVKLIERLAPLLSEMDSALDVLNAFRDRPTGTLRLNVPSGVARTVLPAVLPAFMRAYPDIHVEVIVEDGFVDILSVGCDAGVRYDERLDKDMIAVPIGPRSQRFATAAAPVYLQAHGRPKHPRDLLSHACLRGQFSSGATPTWEYERDGEIVRVEPKGPLVVRPGAASDLKVSAALAGLGIVYLWEDMLKAHLNSGALEAVLEPWWQRFTGPFLYYPGRRHVPAPLRVFIDFLKTSAASRARKSPAKRG